MAMTLSELESALNALTTRIEQIEQLLDNTISVRQLNQVTLVLESELETLNDNVTTLKGQVSTLEGIVNEIK